MANLFPIQKQQEHPIFGRFNALYGDTLVEQYPPLLEFQITILTKEEFKTNPGVLPIVKLDNRDAFAYSSDKQNDSPSSTKAVIIYNPALIEILQLTEEEQFAAIAHEIGHIIYRFSTLKNQYSGKQGQEIYSDSIAANIGLASEMISVIEKLEGSGMFNDAESRFGMRKLHLRCMYNDTIVEEDY